jgi:hypothetical protein
MSSENGYESDFRFRFRKMSLTVRVGLHKVVRKVYGFVAVKILVSDGY